MSGGFSFETGVPPSPPGERVPRPARGRGSRHKNKSGSPDRPRDLPTTLPGWELQLSDAAELLDADTRAASADAIRLFDSAVGLKAGVRGHRGLTLSANAGCKCLPIYLVRRVEYEGAMRRLNWSEMEIAKMHGLFSDAWYYGDVKDTDSAGEYLMRATLVGNRFAKRVLDWLAPERARGLSTTKDGGREEYLRAIREGERERAVDLGRMVVSGGGAMGEARMGGGRGAVRADATVLVKMGGNEQKALAANNIGYLLAHGAQILERDVAEALCYYEMAIEWGSASAACNMAFMLHYGADGEVKRDGGRARILYELAIKRGERNYAPRNLGILLHHGAPGVRGDVVAAARYLLLGLREGNEVAKVKCARSLAMLMRSWRMWWSAPALKKECEVELARANGRGRSGDDIDAESAEIDITNTNPYGM